MDPPEVETSVQQPQVQPNEPIDKKGLSIRSQLDWDLDNFDEQSALKDLSRLANQNVAIEEQKNNPKLYIADSTIKSMTINKLYLFILRGESEETGKIEITRKYSDFYALRQALVRRWPGCYIPPVPQKGNIGNTEKQIMRNKIHLLSAFLNKTIQNSPLFSGQEYQVFLKSDQNDVEKNLGALKPHNLENLFGIYKAAWPEQFHEVNQLHIESMDQKIKAFETYFTDMKKDLAKQKDQIKRLAQIRTKLTIQRSLVLQKTLPQYEQICLNWFNGKTAKQEQKPEIKEGEDSQKKQDEQIIEQGKNQNEDRIYSNPKYQGALEAYKDQLFPKEEGQNQGWVIYQMFKYELRQIEAMIQAIGTYKYIAQEKRFYQRNIEGNKQQLEDINNKKMSLKILLLAGSQDEKKTQLANQTQLFENRFKLCEELWNALTQHVMSQLERFQQYRCQFYKKSLMRAFKKQGIYMAKLFNLYVEIHKL